MNYNLENREMNASNSHYGLRDSRVSSKLPSVDPSTVSTKSLSASATVPSESHMQTYEKYYIEFLKNPSRFKVLLGIPPFALSFVQRTVNFEELEFFDPIENHYKTSKRYIFLYD